MELVDLYDENRVPLGLTAERHCPKGANEYRMVVHVCLFDSRGRLLIQKRTAEKRVWPCRWDVSVGGGVDAGETSRQGAEREFREELGCPLDLTDLRPVVADAALAEIFQIPMGSPLLNMDEVDFDIDGKPVFCSNEYFADGIFRHTVMRKKL